MSKLIFSYNFNRDIENYLNSIYKFRYFKYGDKNLESKITKHIPKETLKLIRKSKTSFKAKKHIQQFLEDFISPKKIKNVKKKIEKAWEIKEKAFLEKLEGFYQKPVYFSKVNVYFTSLSICPYNSKEGWLMIPLNTNVKDQIAIICHELMHFMFHRYYEDYCKRKISLRKFEDIKEALTVFLNTEFSDIININDRGYPAHQKLRKFLLKEWKKNKDFKILLDATINSFKK